MYTRWTQHLKDPEDIEDFKKEIYSSRVLDRLREILKEDERTLDRAEEDPRTYDKPNWDYRQAHKNGVRQYNHIMQSLVNLDQERQTNG